jgi:hypothetical protein
MILLSPYSQTLGNYLKIVQGRFLPHLFQGSLAFQSPVVSTCMSSFIIENPLLLLRQCMYYFCITNSRKKTGNVYIT